MVQHSENEDHSVRVEFLSSEKKTLYEVSKIGLDKRVYRKMCKKALGPALMIDNVRNVAANIIKQEMLAADGEAAVCRGSITHSVDFTPVLLSGNLKSYKILIDKLKKQPFGLSGISFQIELALKRFFLKSESIKCGDYTLNFAKKVYTMGILNLTPDSFYDGNSFKSLDQVFNYAEKMIEDGADILDIGGESTRPGSLSVSEKEEALRILPFIKKFSKRFKIPISVDTSKSSVAKKALSAGASIINDISGLRFDPKMANVVKDYDIPVILMHTFAKPKDMQINPRYNNLMLDIFKSLNESISILGEVGADTNKVIIDPGIGFGKTVNDNLKILDSLSQLKSLGKPILVGVSRKSFIGKVLDLDLEERLEGSLASAAVSVLNGANMIRTHDVKETVRTVKMIRSVMDS